MESSGPLASNGRIAQGSTRALIAVISGVAQNGSAFADDTLTVSTSALGTAAAFTAPRAPAVAISPKHAQPAEARPADAEALLAALRAQATGAVLAAGTPEPSRHNVFPLNAGVGSRTSIWVQQGGYGSHSWVQVPATLAVQTQHANIWIENALLPTVSSDAAQIAADFENAYASDTAHFASPDYGSAAPGMQPQYSYCDANGSKTGSGPAYIAEPADARTDVMVVQSSTISGLGGYFSAANVMKQAALNCLGQDYHSNEAPVIYVAWAGYGTRYELQEDLVRSTAHEFQHLINFVNHAILARGASSPSFDGNESQYLNEGLSMLAQDFAVARMFGSQGVQFDAADALQRAQAYLADPGSFSISAFSGADAPSWGGDGRTAHGNCAGGCYGGAYLFVRYLHDRFGGDAFTRAVETSGATGAANLQAVTGEQPGDLIGDFALAMAANTLAVPASDPRFSFGTLDLTAAYSDQFGAQTQLSGAAAVSPASSSFSVEAPVGGFTFAWAPPIPSSGMSVQVSDQASVGGFSLLGGLAQH